MRRNNRGISGDAVRGRRDVIFRPNSMDFEVQIVLSCVLGDGILLSSGAAPGERESGSGGRGGLRWFGLHRSDEAEQGGIGGERARPRARGAKQEEGAERVARRGRVVGDKGRRRRRR